MRSIPIQLPGMKLFASICGVAALTTAAVNFQILRKFEAMYADLGAELPAITRFLLSTHGALPTALLAASAMVVLVGILRKSNRWMLAGGIACIVMMLGAATVIPFALMVPLSKLLSKDHPPAVPPAVEAGPERADDSIED